MPIQSLIYELQITSSHLLTRWRLGDTRNKSECPNSRTNELPVTSRMGLLDGDSEILETNQSARTVIPMNFRLLVRISLLDGDSEKLGTNPCARTESRTYDLPKSFELFTWRYSAQIWLPEPISFPFLVRMALQDGNLEITKQVRVPEHNRGFEVPIASSDVSTRW